MSTKPPKPYRVVTCYNGPDHTPAYICGFKVGSDARGEIATFGPWDGSEARDLAKRLNDAYAAGLVDANAGTLFAGKAGAA